MKRVGFSDWQEMALKKDVEEIKKKMYSQEPIFFSLCWEIVVAVGSIIIDHLFDTEQVSFWVWEVVILLAVIPPMIVLICQFGQWLLSIKSAQKGKLKVQAHVDAFDNQISYWVMLGNSYADMLTEALSDGHSTDAEKEFLYREGCYYNNKSMRALYYMKPNFNKIISSDIKVVQRGNVVDRERLCNLLMVMNEQQLQLDRDIMTVHSHSLYSQQEINKKYLSELMEFLTDFNRDGTPKMEWRKN